MTFLFTNIRLALSLAFLATAGAVAGELHYTLNGYRVGQSLAIAKRELGKPAKNVNFDDGWKALAFKHDSHFVIFEMDNVEPGIIRSITIQGSSNPPEYGLAGLNLGMSKNEAVQRLRKPDRTEQASDAITKKSLTGTEIHHYENFSYETVEDKVTSIKVSDQPNPSPDTEPDVGKFLEAIRNGNLYWLCDHISPDLSRRGKPVVTRAILKELQQGGSLYSLFFDAEKGLVALDEEQRSHLVRLDLEPSADLESSARIAYTIPAKKTSLKNLVFLRTAQGWLLTGLE